MARINNQLYGNVVDLTRINLGKVGETLVDRQIHDRLHKDPQYMTGEDLKRLIYWIRAAVSLVTDDMSVIDDYVKQLRRLAEYNAPREKLPSA